MVSKGSKETIVALACSHCCSAMPYTYQAELEIMWVMARAIGSMHALLLRKYQAFERIQAKPAACL